jgi:hypothetical protein
MTYRQYKLILLCFLLVFALSAVFRNFITGSNLPTLILLYAFTLLYWLLLFFFLLYARKKGITEDNKKIAPAKLLPIVVAWLVFISVLYPITMIGISKTVNALVYRKIAPEDTLARIKKAATDTSKTAEQRLKAARFYYRYSGERIIYVDEKDTSEAYLPNENANQERLKYLEGLQQQSSLYHFMVVSGVLSLLSGVTVATIYLRTRKNY